MTRKLLRRKGWRAPVTRNGCPELIAEIERCDREARDAYDKPMGELTPDELERLAIDIRIRADSAADQLEIVAKARRRTKRTGRSA